MANFVGQFVDFEIEYGYIAGGPVIVPGPDPDILPPVISNIDPPPGSSIGPTQPITFDVTDDSGSFARIFTVAWFKQTGDQEVIHDGDAFVGPYAAGSSRVPITNGFRYIVTRSNGWTSSPTLRVFPIDLAGNQPIP